MTNFKENFIEVVSDNTSKYFGNGAASLLKRLVKEPAERGGCGLLEAAEAMSHEPDFGKTARWGALRLTTKPG